ncbi:MAG: precorrin-3B synthase [Mesorhizobium sp.]|nr:precorrin-3B synthase [Mesorhizobium sp.]MBL8575958.1 precorrin-3B synthase [Mesorhizobium sp.]
MTILAAARPIAGGFSRRGACPALSAPMKTGDGLLVRLNPVAGGLSPDALIGLCKASEKHGNGIVEVTARGSLQIRGLTAHSAAEFAAAVNKLGIPVRTGVPVQTGVLAGLDPEEIADPTAIAESIRNGIARAGLENRLGPKVSVVVDSGGLTALDEVAADVRLAAVDSGWLVGIAGEKRSARPLGLAQNDQAAGDVTLTLLSAIAEMGREARGRDVDVERLPDRLQALRPSLPPSGLPATRVEMAGRPEGGVKEQRTSLIGLTNLRTNLKALGIALPFGHTTADRLKTFAEKARSLRINDIRPAPRRTLVAICGTEATARELRKTAEALGFITSADDPTQSISACPGAPDCASGHMAARILAADMAKEHGDFFDGSLHLHVSGCAKGCAHPAASTLTMVGSERGIGLVANGTARDEATAFADRDAAGRAFANVTRVVSAERLQGETAAHAIQRIGLSRLAEAFGKSRT